MNIIIIFNVSTRPYFVLPSDLKELLKHPLVSKEAAKDVKGTSSGGGEECSKLCRWDSDGPSTWS